MLNMCAKECTQQSRWKETTQRYMSNMLINNISLQEEVLNHEYKVHPTIDFKINERGHIRQIEAPVVRDRVVHKTLTKNVLIPALRPYLIYDNYASLELRGTTFARKRFEIMLKDYVRKNGNDGYILLIDIKKYFESIDHDVLKALITPKIKDVSQDVMDLIYYVIDTSSHTGKGLNLGSEAPQIFAVFFLGPIDNYVKIVRGVKYYGRYMDDIFVIGSSKDDLASLLREIEGVLAALKLVINEKKTSITKLSHGFTWLQIKYNILPTGRILKRPAHKKIVRERRRLKAFKRMLDAGQMTELEIWNCYQSWRGTLVKEHNACYRTLKSMDALYKSLFPEHEEYKRIGRKEVFKEVYKTAEKEDLKFLFNI